MDDTVSALTVFDDGGGRGRSLEDAIGPAILRSDRRQLEDLPENVIGGPSIRSWQVETMAEFLPGPPFGPEDHVDAAMAEGRRRNGHSRRWYRVHLHARESEVVAGIPLVDLDVDGKRLEQGMQGFEVKVVLLVGDDQMAAFLDVALQSGLFG